MTKMIYVDAGKKSIEIVEQDKKDIRRGYSGHYTLSDDCKIWQFDYDEYEFSPSFCFEKSGSRIPVSAVIEPTKDTVDLEALLKDLRDQVQWSDE